MLRFIIFIFSACLLFSQYPTELPAIGKNTELVFIYIHGFGEYGDPTSFETEMRKFLKPVSDITQVFTFRWDKVLINPLKVTAQWEQSKNRADTTGVHFLNNIILKLEEKKIPYIIIGYSLGTRVVSGALTHCSQELKYLQNIYFLASALPYDHKPNIDPLPGNMKITTYYSKYFDQALKIGYGFSEDVKAGGETGFSDSAAFINYRTVCTHVHKGGPLERDYTELAEPIGYLSLMERGIFLKESYNDSNVELPVMDGEIQWNDIIQYNVPRKILIQQNMTTGHYRAVEIAPDGSRTRIAWGKYLHVILDKLGLFGETKKIMIVP